MTFLMMRLDEASSVYCIFWSKQKFSKNFLQRENTKKMYVYTEKLVSHAPIRMQTKLKMVDATCIAPCSFSNQIGECDRFYKMFFPEE